VSPGKSKVVALGGGHGLSVALRAIRVYAGEITAVVSVADDGGSSGRLRRDLDVPAPGDLRKCLLALADPDNPWVQPLEHRFRSGDLADHPLGNLMIVGLAEALGDLPAALDQMGAMLGAVGRVLPATAGPVSLTANVGERGVTGQVAIAQAGDRARIHDVRLVPEDAAACPDALAAIARADQVIWAPGSLYTSIVAVVCVPEIRDAVARASGRVIQIANVEIENETAGLDGTDHLEAMHEHQGRVDTFVYDPVHGLPVDEVRVRALGAIPVAASIASESGHDPPQLARTLAALL
jgi:uncharacterized cofD-like protein